MFTRIKGFGGAAGVVFFLIFAYLVLTHSVEARRLIAGSTNSADKFARTLQGR